MKKYIITATGTEIGKTLITAALAHQIRERGDEVAAIKPIISGYQVGKTNDTEILIKAQGLRVNQKSIHNCSPWRFIAPISADVAARYQGQQVNFDELAKFCNDTATNSRYLLIEGVGGVMSPLTNSETIIDLIPRVKAGVLLVAGSYLGSISHTLTAIAVLKAKGISNIKIVISESPENAMPIEETANSIARFCDYEIMVVPRIEDGDYKSVPDITSLIL
ncbi:MAG: dethiobiotin synthase [Alphaproteobacteria bacterium CG11_big_fil_rev_8_21_14_0_20_44_7]|nr:MAG: dethiobiotin synthase [Alphaproteobacteria bacterium CG11_big_fil_rev_8_21_14_0_20_44_7]